MAEQKTLVLTGASRGIGHATVKRFGREGWRVLTCSRHPFDPRCPWPNGEANHIQIDLASPDKTIAAIEKIKEKLNGSLDALVNNAGISPKGPGGSRLNTLETDLRTWGQVFHVNFFASIVLARGLKDELSAAKASVVNVTSIAGIRVHPFAGAAYSTSKAALAAVPDKSWSSIASGICGSFRRTMGELLLSHHDRQHTKFLTLPSQAVKLSNDWGPPQPFSQANRA